MALLEEVKKKYGLNGQIYSVTDFCSNVKQALSSKPEFAAVHVLGEITNLAHPQSGHYYFSLTDGTSNLACVFFRPNHKHGFQLEDGQQVLVVGSVSVHPSKSVFQINVKQVYPVGEGIESIKLKQLKEKLDKEGLFAASRKKPLPVHPKTVGLVVAKGSEAERDVVDTLRQTAPDIGIQFAYARVSGKEAADTLVNALYVLNRMNVDVIIMARGGGPKEDLSVFNDEALVRAIVASKIPVVTGIGHESDVTLSDFAADKSAITPTAAAKEVTGDALSRAKAEKERAKKDLYDLGKLALILFILLVIVLLVLFGPKVLR